MSQRFLGQSLRTFTEELSSSAPTPGGGSASALAGALGAAVAGMVVRIALRKKNEAETLADLAEEADNLRVHFLRLVEDDSAAFDRVSAAMKLPKSTEAERTARDEAMQAALLAASRVPLDTAKASRRLLGLCGRLVDNATPAALSDAGVGALLAEAALRGAALNVMINLASLKDAGHVKALSEELDQALEGAERERHEVIERVEARIAR
jgi:formiminotetrahydrofolate cyclodeaminase